MTRVRKLELFLINLNSSTPRMVLQFRSVRSMYRWLWHVSQARQVAQDDAAARRAARAAQLAARKVTQYNTPSLCSRVYHVREHVHG